MPTRPVSSAAITVEPEPMNVSSTGSPRLVTSRMASAIMSTGLSVGCDASSSSRSAPNEFKPRYVQRFERFRPCRPSSTLLV